MSMVVSFPSCRRSSQAAQGLGRYIKRKSMDPLETYVPAVLQARAQLLQAGAVMGAHPLRVPDKGKGLKLGFMVRNQGLELP